MPHASNGNIWKNAAGRWYFRVRLGKRHALSLPVGFDEGAARRREERLRALVAKLRAGKVEQEGALPYLEAVAAATDPDARDLATADVIRYAKGEIGAKLTGASTIADVAEGLTSGRLSMEYPDHVSAWGPRDSRRSYLTNHVLPEVGKVRVTAFKLDDALRLLASLPPHLSQATRAAIAGILDLMIRIAVFPLRLREASPLPRGWAPSRGKPGARPFLYPEEDRKLLACVDVPLNKRILYGFLAREGCRTIEARAMTWSDFDLARGAVRLDANKTDDPRAWALGEDVTRALLAWRNVLARILGRPVGAADPVFVQLRGAKGRSARRPETKDAGKVLGIQHARDFRAYLLRAGVDREELHVAGKLWKPIVIHGLRGTFVTLALANGRTETWVADRTGHKTSDMINQYRRAARHAGELDLGWLAPLDEAIPELRGAGGEKVTPLRAARRTG